MKALLFANSSPTSLTCVVKRKGASGTARRFRRPVRTLTALVETIYKSFSPTQKTMSISTFRRIRRMHCPEYRRGQRRTDLWKKLVPRASAFVKEVFEDMEAACPKYWAPALAGRRTGPVLRGDEILEKLALIQEYLSSKHEKNHQEIRRQAPQPALSDAAKVCCSRT